MTFFPLRLSIALLLLLHFIPCHGFEFEESTIDDIQLAFKNSQLTSRQLVEHYLHQIHSLNPLLHAVIEVNPDALRYADRADRARRTGRHPGGGLHGIPVLLKDLIATGDRLNTTAGSLALLGSIVPRDAGVVRRLRRAGAIILGKASLTEWAKIRSFDIPNGWSVRGGQGRNPYVLSSDPCGSSSGSAIAVAANMVPVSLGTETDRSILCPAAYNSVVGIKPTVGLTSRAGAIPVSLRQDTIGPICRTVSDAVHVLEVIVGYDQRDAEATSAASRYIPPAGYRQFLKVDGLKGKRLGILRKDFFDRLPKGSVEEVIFKQHFDTLRQRGAILIDNLELANASVILDSSQSGEMVASLAEFKIAINSYLSELSNSKVKSLADIISFNNNNSVVERVAEFGQINFLAAQNTSGLGPAEREAIAHMKELSMEGLERLMAEKELDAVVTPDARFATVLGIGGYPGISVPAGYGRDGKAGVPFGICFGGLKGSESKLIEIAYAFEQATNIREPPSFISSVSALDLQQSYY